MPPEGAAVCACRRPSRPQWRTARDATQALREHESKRHAGQTIDGTWYVQAPATAVASHAHRCPKDAHMHRSVPVRKERRPRPQEVTPNTTTTKGRS